MIYPQPFSFSDGLNDVHLAVYVFPQSFPLVLNLFKKCCYSLNLCNFSNYEFQLASVDEFPARVLDHVSNLCMKCQE